MYLELPLILSHGIAIQGLSKCFLICLYLQTIWGVYILGVFTRRMDFFFSFFNKYLSPPLPPSHINILAKTDKVPTHLAELKYFYGGGCLAGGRGWRCAMSSHQGK